MKIIIISGTPGVGKTTVATLLNDRLYGFLISLTTFIKSRDLFEEWDPVRETHIINELDVKDALLDEIKRLEVSSGEQYLIIEGIFPDIIGDIATFAFVLRLHPELLERRLKERDYSIEKVRENVQAELLGTCTYHMKEVRKDNFYDIDTSNLKPSKVAEIMEKIIMGKITGELHEPGLIDWINQPGIDLIGYFGNKE